MNTFQLNISSEDDKGKLENFYYQKFYDHHEWRKIREVIRIVNEFPDEPKPFEFKKVGWMTSYELDDLTRAAQQAVKESGQSLNYELVKLINAWVKENS
jgi:hypothetical protein